MSIQGIADSALAAVFGVVMIRQDNSTGNWTLVDWSQVSGVYIDQLSPGNYTYALILVCGSNTSAQNITSTTFDSTAKLTALLAKR
jgi:hypothetical protein